MRVFLIQIGSMFSEHIRAVELLAKDHKILYWVQMKEAVPLDTSRFPGTIFHSYRDALKNIPPTDLNGLGAKPWSAGEIAKFHETGADLMSMMDKWYPEWPILKRQDFFYELLRYWGSVLDRFTPDAIIFHAPPHEMFSFVLYAIARARGIRTAMFDCILGQDRVILYNDYKEGDRTLAREARGGFKEGASSLDSLSAELQAHYREVSQSPNPTPGYVAAWKIEVLGWGKIRRRAKALLPFIKDGSIFERGISRIFKILKAGIKDEYRKYEKIPDFSKPYVYVPLNYQPECTTSPQGGIFVDQVLMVKMLAAALPSGWMLYVKEHPAQVQAHGNDYTPYRYRGFFKTIAELPNVCLVPTGTNTFELTKNAKAVATVAGTAAWEAVLRGKPALVFGYPWFMHAPGVMRVSSTEECEAALARIESGFLPDKKALINYLARVEAVSFRGYTSGYGKKAAKLDEETSVREMHRALEAALILED